jgi:hypothetical protein
MSEPELREPSEQPQARATVASEPTVVPAMTEEHRWGEPITPAQQAELREMLEAWQALGADHGERAGPFEGVRLTGAEVGWLADHSGRDVQGLVPDLR